MSEPRAWRYGVAFLALVALAAVFLPWRESDWWLYGRLARVEPPALSSRLMFVDVPRAGDLAAFRADLGTALRALARNQQGPPWIVVLDIAVSSDARGVDALTAALRSLREARTRLYGVVDPMDNNRLDARYMERHSAQVYSLLDGVGHTVFGTRGVSAAYESQLPLGAGHPPLPALSALVASAQLGTPSARATVVLKPGRPESFRARTFRLVDGTLRGPDGQGAGDLRQSIVIVGNLAEDISTVEGRSGPELIAWALNEHLATPEQGRPRALLAHPALLLSLLAAAVALAVGAAALLYRLVPRSHSHLWVLPLAGGVAGLAALAATVASTLGLHHTMPQITLIALAVAAASALTGLYLHRYQQWQDSRAEPGEAAQEYDVFVSYSRTPENARWVDTQVMPALAQARRADGQALRVFRDTDRIRVGDPWFRRIVHALNASRAFLPVYSADYFDKVPCVKELERAAQKEFTSEHFLVLPVSRLSHAQLLAKQSYRTYDKYQYVDACADARFMDAVIDRLAGKVR